MAYQNIGSRPRFYINQIEWLNTHIKMLDYGSAQGGYGTEYAGGGSPADRTIWSTLPVKQIDWSHNGYSSENSWGSDIKYDFNYLMILGHNFGNRNGVMVYSHDFPPDNYLSLNSINNGGVVDGDGFNAPEYNGLSLWHFTSVPLSKMAIFINGVEGKAGSVLMGQYYTMPHSPDLKLTMSREMDGIKRTRTKGGSDLVNIKYNRPPRWGQLGAYHVGTSNFNEKLARSGRRIWDLSFSGLMDQYGPTGYELGDVSPYTSSLNWFETRDPDGVYLTADSQSWATLLNHNNIFSQVIHKTNGFQLPFVFMPNEDDPMNVAICKFDMKSIKFKQTSNTIYSTSLKIKEVW